MSPKSNSRKPRHGFTLSEVMVTTSLFGILSTALASFMVDSSEGMFWSMKKSLISRDVRNFTIRISQETLGANTGYVYASYDKTDRDTIGDRKQSGETGDCLILIHYDPYPDLDDDKHYTKLTAYYRQPDENGESPVYRVEKSFETPVAIDTSSGYNHFEEFLSTHFGDHLDSAEVVLELSRGLANGQLFQNFGNNSFIINGEILHGNTIKEVTNTYNLTISPRG